MRHFPHFPTARLSLVPGLILALLLAALVAGSAAPPARADQPDGAPGSRVVIAGAARDTLPYAWQEILPVAIVELERNDWTLQRSDSASSGASHRLVTRWKPIKHVLARVFLGSVLARCVVDFEALAGGGTVVTIQGGLASREDLEGSPGFAAAQTAYRRAAARWLERVKAALEAQAPAGPVSRR